MSGNIGNNGIPAYRDVQCPICYEDWNNQIREVTLRCRHVFHEHCIEQHWRTWIEQQPLLNRFPRIVECPSCRERVPLPYMPGSLALPPGWIQERINNARIELIIADNIVPIAEQNTEEAGTLLAGYLRPEVLNQIDTDLLIQALTRAAINGCTGNARRLLENPEVMRQILQLEHGIRYLGDVFVAAARHNHQDILALFFTPQVSQNMIPMENRAAHNRIVNEYCAEALIQAWTNQHEAVVTYLLTPQVQRHANQCVGAAFVQILQNQEWDAAALYARFFEERIITFIPATGENSLGHAFTAAAQNRHLNAMGALIGCHRFRDIPPEGKFGLGAAFAAAAQNGRLRMVQDLIQRGRFSEIPAGGQYSLAGAFSLAAQHGQRDVVEALIECGRFGEIPVEGIHHLGYAFAAAAQNGHHDVVKLLIGCRRFDEIPVEGNYSLGLAFALAAQTGRRDVVESLIESRRFDEIPVEGNYNLGHAFALAAHNGHRDVMEALIECRRFGEIPTEGDFSLAQALTLAVVNDHPDIANILQNQLETR